MKRTMPLLFVAALLALAALPARVEAQSISGLWDASVVVNGVVAEVDNGGFRAENVSVAEGAGTITVVATDMAGNTALRDRRIG